MEFKFLLRRMMVGAILLGLAIPITQTYKMIKNGTTTNVPITGYIIYLFVGCFWLTYGITIKDGIIIFSASLNLLTTIVLLALAKYYSSGGKEVKNEDEEKKDE